LWRVRGSPSRISRVAPDSTGPRDLLSGSWVWVADRRVPQQVWAGRVLHSCGVGSLEETGMWSLSYRIQPGTAAKAFRLPAKGSSQWQCTWWRSGSSSSQTTGVQTLAPPLLHGDPEAIA
jgi:hypothetical protein